MFTGIVEATATLARRERLGQAGKLWLKTALAAELKLGDSLAVNGCCLTVETLDAAAQLLGFHTLAETLDKTNLGSITEGQHLNLERPLCLGDRLGGHLVSGHIDGTAPVLEVARRGEDTVITVALPEPLAAYAIPKGSIAVDGISLTIASLEKTCFRVHIIPFTWNLTNLHEAVAGKLVNLEMDMVGKFVLRREQLAAC